MEAHWFLRKPLDMIMTHLPKDPLNQFLDPTITQHAFFSLPHVRNPFFWHRMRILNFKNHLSSADDDDEDSGVYYISLKLEESNISCYAETEGEDGSIIRGLAQCLTDDHDNRICKIKAVLPSHQTSGWLKIYAGPSLASSSSTTNQQQQQQETIQKSHYPLAMCIRITQPKPTTPFDFVQLYVDHNEFYVQEPQCYKLYPLQTYHFCIRGNRLDNHNRATHHKLAIKSPCGRLYKLMYYPQDQTYDVNVTVSEAGKWSLICLLHHTGGWYTVANWACSILKK
jgi:transglutaminase/protease-like cytokinesis protein 3